MFEAPIDRLFRAHPRSVGESYAEHMAVAAGFGARLLRASLACFLHALVPALCERTGSTAIRELHDRMVVNRRRTSERPGEEATAPAAALAPPR
jgi:hypothetical protein